MHPGGNQREVISAGLVPVKLPTERPTGIGGSVATGIRRVPNNFTGPGHRDQKG
jgi:hypothetical protein